MQFYFCFSGLADVGFNFYVGRIHVSAVLHCHVLQFLQNLWIDLLETTKPSITFFLIYVSDFNLIYICKKKQKIKLEFAFHSFLVVKDRR